MAGAILLSDFVEARHAAELEAAAPGVPRVVIGPGGALSGPADEVEIAYFSGDLFPARSSEFWRPVLGLSQLRGCTATAPGSTTGSSRRCASAACA